MPTALLVTSRWPVPAWRGIQVRTKEWRGALENAGWTVRVLAHDEGEDQSAPGVEGYSCSKSAVAFEILKAALAGRPGQEALHTSGRAKRRFKELVDELEPNLIIVQVVRCGWAVELARKLRPRTPVIFDAIDALGLNLERRAANSDPLRRVVFGLEGRRCDRREAKLAGIANRTVAVARRDLDRIAPPKGRGSVIPVSASSKPWRWQRPKTPTLIVTGNLGYAPTRKGVRRLLKGVVPVLEARYPGFRLVLAGSSAPEWLRRAASREPAIELIEEPEQLGPLIAAAHAALAPMPIGAGVPMKVIEAWAVGTPVIAHPWATGGLVGDLDQALLVAESDEQWIEACCRLFDDEDVANDLSDSGTRLWRRHYAPEAIDAAIVDLAENSIS